MNETLQEPRTTFYTKTIIYFALLFALTAVIATAIFAQSESFAVTLTFLLSLLGIGGLVTYGIVTIDFFFKRYALKHLLIGAGFFSYLLILTVVGQNGGLISEWVFFGITGVWEIATIAYAVALRRGAIKGLNSRLEIPLPWRTSAGFAMIGLVTHIIGLISFNFMMNPLVIFALPGLLSAAPFLGMCPPPPMYIDYGPVPACRAMWMLCMGTVVWFVLGTIIGTVQKRTTKN